MVRASFLSLGFKKFFSEKAYSKGQALLQGYRHNVLGNTPYISWDQDHWWSHFWQERRYHRWFRYHVYLSCFSHKLIIPMKCWYQESAIIITLNIKTSVAIAGKCLAPSCLPWLRKSRKKIWQRKKVFAVFGMVKIFPQPDSDTRIFWHIRLQGYGYIASNHRRQYQCHSCRRAFCGF